MASSGKMQGEMYYSDTRPKGTGKEGVTYDPRLYNLAYSLVYTPTGMHDYTRDSLAVLQENLENIGYLHADNPQSQDRKLGRMSTGAARRYVDNFYSENWQEEIKDKSFWDILKRMAGY